MKLGVIGAGYVGLTTAICLSSIRHSITIFDIDKNIISSLKNKKIPFYEPDLQELMDSVISSGRLHTADSIDKVVRNTNGVFVCVGTPSKPDGSIDISQILSAVKDIAQSIKNNNKKNYTILIRSTIVPYTTRQFILPLLNIVKEYKVNLCSVPEFLREGQAVSDFMNPDKIVIGFKNLNGKNFARKVFQYFKKRTLFIETNFQTAEMIKYTNNAFFSTLISFANEIANISEKISGIDTFEVINALIADKRITTLMQKQKIVPEFTTYLFPGCGFGGSCFPKDVKAITAYASSVNAATPLLNSVLTINEERPRQIVLLAESLIGILKSKKISVLGLAFKPNTDDLRSSPSLEAIKILQKKKAVISVYDPVVRYTKLKSFGISNVNTCTTIEKCLKNSDLAIVFTKWEEFKSINSKLINKHMRHPLIIDGRGFLDKNKFREKEYYKIGYKK